MKIIGPICFEEGWFVVNEIDDNNRRRSAYDLSESDMAYASSYGS